MKVRKKARDSIETRVAVRQCMLDPVVNFINGTDVFAPVARMAMIYLDMVWICVVFAIDTLPCCKVRT